jgi:hypothetical protein
MFNRTGVRLPEVSGGEEAQAGRSTPHVRPATPPERAMLHETMIPTGFRDPLESMDSMSPTLLASPAPAPPLRAPEEPFRPSPARLTQDPPRSGGAQDRRASCRYEVSNAVSVLCWWEPVDIRPAPEATPVRPSRLAESSIYAVVMARGPAFRNVQAMRQSAEERREAAEPKPQETMTQRFSNAEVVDISQTGIAVLSGEVPQSDQKIWLRLDQPSATDWVEVVLKEATRSSQGPHLIRLAFTQPCPYDFFKAALYGKSRP